MNMAVPRYIYVLVNYMTVSISTRTWYGTSIIHRVMFDIMWQMPIGSGCNAPIVQTVVI